MRNLILLIFMAVGALGSTSQALADAVVTDGRFMNVYVYPNPSKETWEEHLNKLPASQKPSDPEKFTRKSIDNFTATLMSPAWPSYFGALYQYGGINPPRFFGSYVAPQKCVDAAMKDLQNGVLQRATIRSLANCHDDGMDPPPQVIIILSPDLKAEYEGKDMCRPNTDAVAYHGFGLNTPNYAVLPTCPTCAPSFDAFTSSLSHEVVEMLSDPGMVGHGGAGGTELGDRCENILDITTGRKIAPIAWKGFNVQRYRSDNDDACWPLNFPDGSSATTWVLAESSPTIRFTGDVHSLTLNVPGRRLITDAQATEVQIWIQTGGDDLRGGNDNADAFITFAGGQTSPTTTNINGGRQWGNGQTHIARLRLPAPAPRVRDIESVTITTHFGGGIGGDNWNVDKVALIVGFPTGSTTSEPPPIVVHEWLDKSDGPLKRFTGSVHDLEEPVDNVPSEDVGKAVSALDLIISTGNDDLRGGGNAGDNCDVTIERTNGPPISVPNANNGSNWKNWTDHTVGIPLPNGGLRGGEVKSVTLHTGFGGGISGDNWNVQRLLLRATLSPESDVRRYDTVWRPGTTAETQLYGMPYDQYQKHYDDLWKKGQRIYQLSTYIENGQRRYDAVWRPGTTAETQLYGMPYDQYQKHYDDLWKKGQRIYLLNTYVENGQRRYDAVWRPGTTAETQLYGMSYDQYQKHYDDLWKKGQRVYLLNTYEIPH